MAKAKFPGFPIESLQFLDSLSRNNHRDWFEKNKQNYEKNVREPALAFIDAMAEPVKKISPHFRVEAKKVGGSLMRVYRDIRFSKDKTPYKTNIGIHFRHVKGKDVHAPGFYFHVDPDQVFIGAGIWHPDSKALTKIRQQIDARQSDWIKINKAKTYSKWFTPDGDSLKRPPKGFAADHPLIDELKRKDFFGLCRVEHDLITSPKVVAETAKRLKAAEAYMAFLCSALGLKF